MCEDVRCEFNGMQTLVGVLNIVPLGSVVHELDASIHELAPEGPEFDVIVEGVGGKSLGAAIQRVAQSVTERGRSRPSEKTEHQRDQHIISASAAYAFVGLGNYHLAQRGFLKR